MATATAPPPSTAASDETSATGLPPLLADEEVPSLPPHHGHNVVGNGVLMPVGQPREPREESESAVVGLSE